MSRKCEKCDIVSETKEIFRKPDYSDEIFYCPACRKRDAIRQGESYLIACVIVIIGGLVWVTLRPQNEFAWLVFQAGLFGCFTIIVTVPHELGHIFAAVMTRARIFQVSIGLGRILYNRDLWGIEWIFHAIPICGYTISGINNRKFYRLRSFLITLGGPLINFLLIVAAIILLFHFSSPWHLAIIRSFIAANVFELILNLLPRKGNLAGTITPSDGLILLTLSFMSESKINQEIEMYYVWEINDYYRRGRFDDARRNYERGLAMFPDSSAITKAMTDKLEMRISNEPNNIMKRPLQSELESIKRCSKKPVNQ